MYGGISHEEEGNCLKCDWKSVGRQLISPFCDVGIVESCLVVGTAHDSEAMRFSPVCRNEGWRRDVVRVDEQNVLAARVLDTYIARMRGGRSFGRVEQVEIESLTKLLHLVSGVVGGQVVNHKDFERIGIELPFERSELRTNDSRSIVCWDDDRDQHEEE